MVERISHGARYLIVLEWQHLCRAALLQVVQADLSAPPRANSYPADQTDQSSLLKLVVARMPTSSYPTGSKTIHGYLSTGKPDDPERIILFGENHRTISTTNKTILYCGPLSYWLSLRANCDSFRASFQQSRWHESLMDAIAT